MKIIQLIFNLTSGGAEKFTVDLSNELSRNNEVFLCVIEDDKNPVTSFFKEKLSGDVNYINLGCKNGINLKMCFIIFDLIKRIDPDVIHAHLNTKLYLYLPAIFYSKRIRFIHTLHSLAHKTVGFKWQKPINRLFYSKGLIAAVAISDECKASYVDFYKNRNVALIKNGVSIPKKSINFENVKAELNSFRVNDTDKIFVHIASFSEAKNQKLLINVFNMLIKRGLGVVLVIIGKNFDSDKGKELQKTSNQGIYFLGTKLNIADYLLNSDVFVLSSLWEGLPISLLEAISCGVIPVSTPAGGIPDVITNQSFGYISADFTLEGLYDAAIKCLDNMDHFSRENLKDYFEKNYSIGNCAEHYESIYSVNN